MEFLREYEQLMDLCKQNKKELHDNIYVSNKPKVIDGEVVKKKRIPSEQIKEILLQGYSKQQICALLGCQYKRINSTIMKYNIEVITLNRRIYIISLLEKTLSLMNKGVSAEDIATKLKMPLDNVSEYITCLTSLQKAADEYSNFFSEESKPVYTSLSEISNDTMGKIVDMLSRKKSKKEIIYKLGVSEEVIKEIKAEMKKADF